ncbi:hypothetical protein AVEN_245695-1 [Araneus ventricosus]|uniref:Uncharacterized protein n=1 Tax=Araneus ventricosus TaxID=182803 RepID=A0A4Y2FQU2_ARAVE|nr:hypothetical protein AVEN_245695-1 [Araneus ventricosus]
MPHCLQEDTSRERKTATEKEFSSILSALPEEKKAIKRTAKEAEDIERVNRKTKFSRKTDDQPPDGTILVGSSSFLSTSLVAEMSRIISFSVASVDYRPLLGVRRILSCRATRNRYKLREILW